MKKNIYKLAIIGLGFVFTPVMAFAQEGTLGDLIGVIIGLLDWALVLMILVAVVMFVFYIIKYFIKADADRKEAGLYVMYSIIGFFVILSMWGLVNILQGTFGLGNEYFQPRTWESFTRLFPESGGGGANRVNLQPIQRSNSDSYGVIFNED